MTDNTLAKARALGAIDGRSIVKRDALNRRDRVDYFKFSLNRSSNVNFKLAGLRANADLSLLDSAGKNIVRSAKPGKKDESMQRQLAAGTYYVRVNGRGSATKYKLTMNATSAPGTEPDPRNPLPARNRLVAIGSKLGEPGTRLGLIDLNTGIVNPRPTSGAEAILPWSDIAVFGNEGYALTLNSIIKLDPTTGVVTDFPNNALNNTGLTALEFTSSGELYGISPLRTRSGLDDRVGGLYKVDIANQKVNLIAEIPNFNGTEFVYDPASNRFFGVSFAGPLGSQLYSIGLAGDARLIGDIGLNGTFVPLTSILLDNGTLYGYGSGQASEGRVAQIAINTTTGAGTLDKIVTVPSDMNDAFPVGVVGA
jgi:hypothetical protein